MSRFPARSQSLAPMKVAVRTPQHHAAARNSVGPKIAIEEPSFAPPLDRHAPTPVLVEQQPNQSTPATNHSRTPFHLNSLVAQVLFVQLHERAKAQYAVPHGSPPKPMQIGVAWRSFSSLFDAPSAIELVKLFENLLRFANHEADAPARAFFLSYAPLSFEHDLNSEFIGPGVWHPESGSRAAAQRVRRTLKRWCDWLEALIHFQIHRDRHPASTNLEADKAIIFLWPLLKRHKWTYDDLLSALRLVGSAKSCEWQSEQQLASYCQNVLGLRQPHTRPVSKPGSLAGKAVADRLIKFLPLMG
jgi:hypothetical protein